VNNKSQNNIIDSLQSAEKELRAHLIVMQKEIIGFCAGTGKIKELNDIGKIVSKEFDFTKAMEQSESKFASLKRSEVMAKENLESYVELNPNIIDDINNKIRKIKVIQSQQADFIKEISLHNSMAKKFKISLRSISSISSAGWLARNFNRDHKRATKILAQISDNYQVKFSGFLKMIENAKARISDFEKDLIAKQNLISGHDAAVDEYRAKKKDLNEFNIHLVFSDLLTKAFNNKTFLTAFSMMSGGEGKSVVDSVFKYRLLKTLFAECIEKVNDVTDSPYDLSAGDNSKILLGKVTRVIETYKAVNDSSAIFAFSGEQSFEDMYRKYLREVSNLTGISLLTYKDKEFPLNVGAILEGSLFSFSAASNSTLEVAENVVETKQKKSIFKNLLSKNKGKRHTKQSLLEI